MSGSTAVFAAVLAAAALAFEPAPNQYVTDLPHLAGNWQLNEAMSEEVPALPGEVTSLARGAGALPAVSLRRPSRTGLDRHALIRVRSALREMLDATRRLAVARRDERLVFTDARGRSMVLVPDGEPVSWTQGEIEVKLRAHWQPPALVVERFFPDDTVVTEHYTTFTDPRQLVVSSTIRNQRIDEPAATLMRVYDLVR